jgi:hypothetical protein
MLSDQNEERIKGFIYSHEPDRVILFGQNRATFRGRNGVYALKFVSDEWECNCNMWGRLPHSDGPCWCRHTLALERMLSEVQEGNILLTQAACVLM